MKPMIAPIQDDLVYSHVNSVTTNRNHLVKRSASGGSTFATHTEHTPAFNTVHIIAAVIGIVGAVAMAVTIFLMCKRKRNRRRDSHNNRKAFTANVSNDIESNMTQTSIQNSNNLRFGQFASDFDNHVEPPKPAVTHVEDISPMMQQYQLQLKLLQQQKAQQQERKLMIDPHLSVPTALHQTSSSSSSSSSPNSLLPPPPYQP
ncbi:hypothetical protein MAM1_0414c10404 [Mucor ambiguus]|uniref:Uncharacterized protein n=1 Tax=Mucor ambiguus TaxID=91626 RepID=A0A0C9MTT4_9FUNG|nr:hypothetical protein MAM1_0414c10404 [Mucor ambiguus]